MTTLSERPSAAPARPVEILLIEDNPGDALLTRMALEEGRILHRLRVVHDGVAALELLHGDYYRPDLILLDLNLPRKDGREVLSELKSGTLRHIPVIVLTTSASGQDILGSYRLHANSYIVKPVDLVKFVQAVRTIEQYWFALVQLPEYQPGAAPPEAP